MLCADKAGIVSRSSEGLERRKIDGDRNCVLGVRAYDLRNQNGDNVPAE